MEERIKTFHKILTPLKVTTLPTQRPKLQLLRVLSKCCLRHPNKHYILFKLARVYKSGFETLICIGTSYHYKSVWSSLFQKQGWLVLLIQKKRTTC